MKITNCKVQHIWNPVGFQMEAPVFSWIVECAPGEEQEVARRSTIRVSEDPSFGPEATVTVLSGDLNALGQTLKMALFPRTRYYFTIEVTFESGLSVKSEVGFFETAKMEEPWAGRWITCERGDRHPIFGKTFTVEKPVKNARLYMSGLGLFNPAMDGALVGDEFLAPFCTDYKTRIQYVTYDVTETLTVGTHTLTAALGNGWYMGRFGFRSKTPMTVLYDTVWKVIGELRIEFEDGDTAVIPTDDSWTVTRSNITFSNIYDGEHRDDTLPELAPEKACYLPEEEAAAIPLQARMSLPVRIVEKVPAAALLDTPAGEKVFDLGQEITGLFTLHLDVPAGTKVHIQTGEVLQQGNFYNANLRTALSEYFYVSNGTPIDLTPAFTFYGYRYVKVSGVDHLKVEDLTGLALSSDLPVVGSLKVGKEKINRLIRNIFWGQRGNFLDVPTDCPQRDERMGWTADTQVFVPTACFNMDTYAFYDKFLTDLRSEQAKFGGMVPDVIPAFGIDNTSSVWGDACCIMPWMLYTMYGDKKILADSLDSMTSWVDYITGLEADGHGWQTHFHYGDWLALDDINDNPEATKGATEEAFIALVYYKNSADLIVKAAKVLGREDVAEKYAALSKAIHEEILEEYFTPTGRLALTTQTAYVLALYYNLTPDREKAIHSLVALLKKNHNHFKTGFVGTPLICKVLSGEGYDDVAYEILHNEEYPGWLYEINLGATTVWERWNSLLPDGSISGINMNSMNHYAYGSIGEWMWRTVAGIQPREDAPGFKKIDLRIVPEYRLGSAEAEYASPSGTYKVSWKIEDRFHVSLSVTIPYGCEAALTVPNAVTEGFTGRILTAGTYRWTLEMKPLWKIFSMDNTAEELLANPKTAPILLEHYPKIVDQSPAMKKLKLGVLLERKSQSEATVLLIRKIDELLSAIE